LMNFTFEIAKTETRGLTETFATIIESSKINVRAELHQDLQAILDEYEELRKTQDKLKSIANYSDSFNDLTEMQGNLKQQQNSFSDRCLGDLAGTVTAEPSWITLPPDGITLEGVEKKLIEQALQRFSGNQSKAARCLGMSRDTIRYRIKKFGLGRKGTT